MISVLVDNPLSFWVVSTTEIRKILSLFKPCIDVLRKAGYIDCSAMVGGGVREQDTGYAAFFRQYSSFSNMEEHLCDDFSAEESKLDGLWFDTLNFEGMIVNLENDALKGCLIYSRGEITLRFDNAEDDLERQILSILEPFQYRDPTSGSEVLSEKEPTDTKKRTAIVFYSKHHGNTKKLLDAIVEKDNSVTLIDVNEQPDADLSSFDRIGLASGIYYSSFAKQIIAFAESNLPEYKDVFYIYTHGAPIGSFLREIRAAAKKKNCREIGKYHCCGFDTFGLFGKIGGISKGHPDEKDISKAVDFYRAL